MKNIIKLGAYEIYPYQYFSNKNRIMGLNYEIIIESLRLQDYEVVMILYKDKEEIYADMRDLKIDGILEIEENIFNEENVLNSDLVLNLKVDIISLNTRSISNIHEVENKNLKLGYIENFKHLNLTRNISFYKLYEYSSYIDLLNDLLNKTIDIGLIDSRFNKELNREDEYNTERIIVNYSVNFDFKIIFREGNLVKRDVFNNGLKRLIDTNQYFEIIRCWENNIDI